MSLVEGECHLSGTCQVVIGVQRRTHSLALHADGLVAPLSGILCPYCHTNPATIISRFVDQETGNELARWRCTIGDEWLQPTRSQVIRMIGYGQDWRRGFF